VAYRDQIPYLWLTGWQHPDHNTLWRFYQAHRGAMRTLMKCTVGTAVEMGLVGLAMQAAVARRYRVMHRRTGPITLSLYRSCWTGRKRRSLSWKRRMKVGMVVRQRSR